MGVWREEWETESFRFPLSWEGADFLRGRMRIERGRLVRFTAQYEAVVDNRTYGVIRYDTAHGRAHRDTLDHRGAVIDKDWLPIQPFDRSLKQARDDIKADWARYRDAFERLKR